MPEDTTTKKFRGQPSESATQSATDETATDEFREEQARVAATQGLTDENAVPEKRPIAANTPDEVALEGKVHRRLREAGELDNEPMPKSAFDKADSDAQRKSAAEDERQEVLHVGAHAVIDNEGNPHHGRFVAITRVEEYEDVEQERTAAAGTPESRFAAVASYECRSRDGRHDLLIVDAEHLRRVEPIEYVPNPT